MPRLLRNFALFAPALLAAACGKSGGGGPCTTCPSPSIAVTTSTSTLTIVQGGNDNLTATITRAGGYTGVVTIVTEGAPTGVTAAASNVTTSGTTTTGTVTVTVAGTVAAGTYNLTVRASGSGVTDVTQGLTLTVTAAPTIAIALSTAAQSVDQGATGADVTVTITRTNFPGTVTLTVEGAPAGVTAVFTPNGTAGNSSVLTLQVGAAVPAAIYNLTVHATGTGVTATPAPLALTVTVPASFTLSASAASTAAGAGGQSQITITRVNFTAGVALTLEGAPTGVTGVFNPTPATGGASTLTLSVDAAVLAQQYTLTVRGASPPLTDRTTTFTLTVTPFVAVGTYNLTTTPTPSLLVGTASGGVAFVVNINRAGGFTGPVTLAATGLPSNLAATITPSVVTGNSAVVSVVPDQSNQVSSSPVVITGTTPGLANQTAHIQISTAIPDLTFDYSACPTLAPIWLAYQDGQTGPWIQLLPLGGKFKIKLTTTQVGFAIVLTGFGGTHPSWVRLRSATEMKAISGIELCDQGNPGPKNVVVSTANLGTSESAFISMGGAVRSASSLQPTVTLMGVQNGAQDLVATNLFQSLNPSASTARMILLRDLNVPDGQNIGTTLDFTNAALAFSPITANIAVQGLVAGDQINGVGTNYSVGASCTQAFLFSSSGGSTTVFGVPALKQRSGDLTGVAITTQNSTGTFGFRQVTEYFSGTLGDRAIALPSSAPIPAVTVLTGEGMRLRFAFSAPSDLSRQVFVNYGGRVSLDATSGWFGDPVGTFDFPDLTGAANFDVTWLPPSTATPAAWFFSLAGVPRANACAPGRVVGASRNGSTP